jgi:hypothetical protein
MSFYPILKWKRLLADEGIFCKFYTNHKDSGILNHDIIIVTSRYFRSVLKNYYGKEARAFVIDYLEKLKKRHHKKVVFYDLGDSTGSRDLDLVAPVDLFLKKQIHKDKQRYTTTHLNGYRLWVEEDHGHFPSCAIDQLSKIQVGWNIGLSDFRAYFLRRPSFYKHLHWSVKIHAPAEDRPLAVSYRGSQGGTRKEQRQQIKEVLNRLDNDRFLTGPPINKRRYLQEMRQSRAIVSPFGYGEVCFRDFEAIINGALLIKPSMEHVDTFPNYYHDGKNYIAVKWDVTDLEERLLSIDNDYATYLPIIENSQVLFRKYDKNGDLFVAHFKQLLDRLS